VARAGVQARWSVRYRHPIATVRTGALVTATAGLTAALELLVLLTAGDRAEQADPVDAALTTAALTGSPLLTAGLAVLWLHRSVPNYRQLLTEACSWVVACDALVVVLVRIA
jgi:hypothetical protein